MIAAFLLPFPLRGYRAPYLWVYYRLLSSFDERMLFIASDDYTRDQDHWRAQNRWEMQPGNAQRLQYQVPTREVMAGHEYGFLSESVFEQLLAESGGNPIAAFRRLLSERVPYLDGVKDPIFRVPWVLPDTTTRLYRCAPSIGQDNDYFLKDVLKLNEPEIAALKEGKIVGASAPGVMS